MVVVCATTVLVYFRVFEPGDGTQQSFLGIDTALNYASEETPDLYFLLVYLIEILLSIFVYTPIVQFVLFTGILGCGCGRLPFVGGRPLSVRYAQKAGLEPRAEV